MRNVLAIARKELNVYFTTPIAYVVFCGMTFIASYLFLNDLQNFAQASMMATEMPDRVDPSRLNLTDIVVAPLLVQCGFVMFLVVPFISMRLMAEEKQQRTFELLMTTPVRPTEIVLGKYLGGLTVLGITVAMLFTYPLVLSHYGASAGNGDAVEWPTVLAGYLGLFLLAASYLSIGLFVSSLTQSQVVAAIIGLVIMFGLWLLSWASASVDNATAKAVLEYLASSQHLIGLVRGEIAVKDFAYFGSLIVLGLFLTQRVVESERWS
jgi:ABC-2 type transport system permease protein